MERADRVKPSVAGAVCGRHPAVAAVDICTRCGTFVCAECVVYGRGEQPFCSDCLALVSKPPSRRATVGVSLSLAGLVTTVLGPVNPFGPRLAPFAALTGLVGLVVSWLELRAIGRGEAPATGRPRALAGVLVGLVHVVVVALLVVLVVSVLHRTAP